MSFFMYMYDMYITAVYIWFQVSYFYLNYFKINESIDIIVSYSHREILFHLFTF